MVETRIYHVLRQSENSWQVVREGFHRPHIVRHSKAEAILMARRLAKGISGARVIIHSPDNAVEREFNVLNDPV